VVDNSSNLIHVTLQELGWLMAELNWMALTEWGELEYRGFH
jgi:hypothetical protein